MGISELDIFQKEADRLNEDDKKKEEEEEEKDDEEKENVEECATKKSKMYEDDTDSCIKEEMKKDDSMTREQAMEKCKGKTSKEMEIPDVKRRSWIHSLSNTSDDIMEEAGKSINRDEAESLFDIGERIKQIIVALTFLR